MKALVKHASYNVEPQVIDINTLEDLIALHKEKGAELIIGMDTYDRQYPEAGETYLSVTVYDDYME